MEIGEDLVQLVAQYVGPRQKAMQSLTLPSAIMAVTTLMVSIYDCWNLRGLSPVIVLSMVFFLFTLLCANAGIDAKHLDDAFASWRRSVGVVILGWIFVMFFIVGYHTPLHDMGCIRCAGTALAVMVAKNAKEAMLYSVIHFFFSLGADLPHYKEEMLFLLISDVYMIYATWGKQNTIEALEQLTLLSFEVSQHSFKSVQDTLLYLCDAVVVLDNSLVVQESSPDLEAVLGRACRPGRNFQEFIHHEDLQRLTETLTDRFALMESGDTHKQEAVQARLQDSFGGPISVHFFLAGVAPQREDVGQSRFLIGMSEQWMRRKKDNVVASSSKSSGRRMGTSSSSPLTPGNFMSKGGTLLTDRRTGVATLSRYGDIFQSPPKSNPAIEMIRSNSELSSEEPHGSHWPD